MTVESTDIKTQENPSKSAERVIAYVDGFNLYFGMKDAGYRQYFWLDVHKLANKLLGPQQVLGKTKYFTARISGGKRGDKSPPTVRKNKKRKRQSTYLDALETIRNFERFEGNYRDDEVKCNNCGRTWYSPEEKMTDVSIATEMLVDAYNDECDTLLLISGDSDLVPPIKKILGAFPKKRVICAFPPERYGAELALVATGKRMIEKGHLKKSQLPAELKTDSGFKLKKPVEWK